MPYSFLTQVGLKCTVKSFLRVKSKRHCFGLKGNLSSNPFASSKVPAGSPSEG